MASYSQHIKHFFKEKGEKCFYTQNDIDNYFSKFSKVKESRSTKQARLYGIKFLIKKCLKLNIDMDNVCRLKDG